MKIGILTYHRAHNYGAVLQALATRLFLQKHGINAVYVDYYPEYHKSSYKPFSYKEFFYHGRYGFKYLKNHILYYKKCKQRYLVFENFISKYIHPFCRSISEQYDLVVYGSDQIWRKQRIGYNPIYFGDNSINARRKITYAASMGKLPSLKNELYVSDLCKNFDSISVREKTLESFLNKHGFQDVALTLDPTLLLDADDWKPYLASNNMQMDYVLLYTLQHKAFDMKQAIKFAKKMHCELIVLHGGVESGSNIYDSVTGPAEFLSLIANAKCILSSSFHGVVFSVIFNKPFYASLNNNADRVKDFLDMLGITECFIDGNRIGDYEIPIINYSKVKQKLYSARERSVKYLETEVKKGL